ncbi:S8 family serine peptidase [Endozoicomonas sp. SM1973]|uniref:S8 family serine peptidase n=1 Tax=Spartinivicinus marinus TaxID=2994442 RepID=A0A853IBJ3_9GAMM|nr:S8 family serine peptidase [Spartinivicinus marinus]MCX4028452.1 S8 family serine peptidase [Spartinivicinus marinus]NYZ67434.1 S8 family serine peptidase [Spartinivicinus marinus]
MVKHLLIFSLLINILYFNSLANADTYSGKGITVAVIDSGINSTHPQLRHVTRHYCFSENWDKENNYKKASCQNNYHGSNNPADHGTHVAGIIAAKPLSGGAPTGVAPQADIVNLRVLHQANNGSNFDIAAALKAIDSNPELQDVKIINMSLGSRSFSSWSCVPPTGPAREIKKYINKLTQKGIIVVAASGNEGFSVFKDFPACLDNVIAVGAYKENMENKETIAEQQRFAHTEVLAPGYNIISTNENFDLMDKDSLSKIDSGTSMATPAVAGCIALMAEKNPYINTEKVKNIFNTTFQKKLQKNTKKKQAAVLDCIAVLNNTPTAKLVSQK